MKRPTPELRRRLIKASQREQWKHDNRSGLGVAYGLAVSGQNLLFPDSPALPFETNINYADFSGILDLVKAPRSTLKKFRQIPEPSSRSKGPTRLIVDLTQLKAIEPSCVLFLASRTHQFSHRGLHWVQGRFPSDPQVFQVLLDAGFKDFVTGSPASTAPEMLPVICFTRSTDEADRTVRPKTALRVKTFLTERHKALTLPEQDLIYAAVAECLENIRSHAYKGTASRRHGWYVCGLYDANTDTSCLSVLDVGVGIIASIERRAAQMNKPLGLDGFGILDGASQGRMTESGEQHRGKGIRWMREFVEGAPKRRLHIFCNGHMISFGQGSAPEKRRIPHFDGTIVRLELSR